MNRTWLIWLTGLPGSGKSTLAGILAERLRAQNLQVFQLDGDEFRRAFGADLGFTAAYVLIEGGYMVREASPLTSAAEVDRPGIRMTVGDRSAYDLYLTRTLKHAEITRETTSVEAIELFLRDGFDVAAGVKASLADYVKAHSGVRLLDGRFMVIEQAMVTTHGPKAVRIIAALIEELKRSGFIADELAKSGQTDAIVAPPA